MDLWHSNSIKVILRKFATDHYFWLLYIWLTIDPNNFKKCYSRISEKHDESSIFAEGVL